MKKIIPLLLLATFVMAVAPATAEPSLPMDPKGQITLSWDKFNSLWETFVGLQKKVQELEKPVVAPPVPFALSGAAYRGVVRPGRVEMEAVFSLEIFEPKAWVKVPFLPASVAVTEALLDGAPFGLIQEDGFHTAVLKGAGRHSLQVRIALKAPKEEEAPVLQMPVPETAMTALSLLFPQPNLDVTVDGAQGQETRAESGGTRVTAALSPTTALSLRWHRALPAEKALPRKIYAEEQTLFTVSEGALRGRWTYRFTVLHQGVRELALRLPEGWNVMNVSMEGLEEWKVEDGADGSRLLARLTYPKKGAIELVVEAERGLADKEDLIPLPRLTPLDVERETGVIAIQAKGAVETAVPEAGGVQALDPQELPPDLWAQAQNPILHAFRHTGKPVLSLAVVRHPDVPVLTTTVDLANALTMMTKRGETVTRVQYHVRNRVKQHLALRLPEGADLWSAFVAGEPVKPTRQPDGEYRVPLARSNVNGEGADNVLVEIVYFSRKAPFGFFGRRSLTLPLPDAPVSRALWSLYLPSGSKPLDFGGDMDRQEVPAIRPMRASFVRRMTIAVGGFAKKAVSLARAENEPPKDEMDAAKAAAAPAPEVQLQGRLLEETLGGRDDESQRAGVFPVAFQIPEEGTLYNFGRSMIVGESPKLTFSYAGASALWFLALSLFAAAGALLFRRFTPRE